VGEQMMPEVTVLDVASADPRGCHRCERDAEFRVRLESRVEQLCEFCVGMVLAQDRQSREGGEGAWRQPSI